VVCLGGGGGGEMDLKFFGGERKSNERKGI